MRMPVAEAFIDTNLLVLLVVGSVDRQQVRKHRRTQAFTPDDYDSLMRVIGALKRVFVTPNTLTEASNLLESRSDFRFLDRLRLVVENSEEVVVASVDAVRHTAFSRLGLTDVVLLESVSERRPLITTDLGLYHAALAKGEGTAFNFTHHRDLSQDVGGISPAS